MRFTEALSETEKMRGRIHPSLERLNSLDETDRAAVLEALEGPTSIDTIAAALKRIGVEISVSTLRRWRKQGLPS